MSIKRLGLITLVCIASFGILTGCEKEPVAQAQEKETQGVQLQNIKFAQWDKQLAAYQPNIVVVDAWAMWCTSCIKRFPKMVEMEKAFEGKNVQFVSLNLDDHQNTEAVAQAAAFLEEIGATFDNYHMNENLIDAFDHFDLIGIPAVLIYDKHGKERYRLTGDNPNRQFTDKDIENAINELLAEA